MREIRLDHEVKQDDYTQYVIANYDIKDVSTVITYSENIVESDDWNIGLIVGNSGSGKSTILNDISKPVSNEWGDKSLISNFGDITSPEEACELLSSVGLGSVPSWLRPYSTLSNGEKHRADIAMTIAKSKHGDIIPFDEFTSVVNRDVAKAISHSLQKYARRKNIKILIASCHYDIIDWLQPDWIHDCQNGESVKKKSNEDLISTWKSFVARTKHGLYSASITI